MKFRGKVYKFRDNVNTDKIIPARYLNTTSHKELAAHCMEGIDSGFIKKVKPGDIMVAGKNFGCGSSREHAPIAIKAAGEERQGRTGIFNAQHGTLDRNRVLGYDRHSTAFHRFRRVPVAVGGKAFDGNEQGSGNNLARVVTDCRDVGVICRLCLRAFLKGQHLRQRGKLHPLALQPSSDRH